jgi:predicted restriction endonuclease
MNYEKSRPINSPSARAAWLLAGDHHDRCAVCWREFNPHVWEGGLYVHHLIRGSNSRSDEPANLLLLCRRHHECCHDGQYRDEAGEIVPGISLGAQLQLKSESNEWNPERLAKLYHKRLPELEPLADYYLRERTRHE